MNTADNDYHAEGVYCGEPTHCAEPFPGALPGEPYMNTRLAAALRGEAGSLAAHAVGPKVLAYITELRRVAALIDPDHEEQR